MNKGVSVNINDQYIRSLAILKLKKYLESISHKDFIKEYGELFLGFSASDYENFISKNVFEIIVSKVEAIREYTDVQVLIEEALEVKVDNNIIVETCDLILFYDNVVEVIKIIPLALDKVDISKDVEIMDLGEAVIDKFLISINIDVIKFSIVQPNLMMITEVEESIKDFIHTREYGVGVIL